MPYASGTCIDCGDTPEDGRSRCSSCAKRRRKRDAERRKMLRSKRACITCGAPVARTKRVNGSNKLVRQPARYCNTHLAYYAARQRAKKRTT